MNLTNLSALDTSSSSLCVVELSSSMRFLFSTLGRSVAEVRSPGADRPPSTCPPAPPVRRYRRLKGTIPLVYHLFFSAGYALGSLHSLRYNNRSSGTRDTFDDAAARSRVSVLSYLSASCRRSDTRTTMLLALFHRRESRCAARLQMTG